MRLFLLIFTGFLVSQCVGVDYLDDPIIGESIEISVDPIAVMVGETEQAKITFKDKYGIVQEVNPVWTTSSPDIASVDDKGIVTGKKPGQTFLIVSHGTVKDTALVTVVGDATKVAKVEVIESITILSIGQSLTLTAIVKNINNQPISGKMVNWLSSNELVLSINSAGVLIAKTNGTASVVAVVDGVTSNPVSFTVGSTTRMGTFVKSGGYEASGTCNLTLENGHFHLFV
jgi:uncharacterized protein YjdB